MRSGDETNHHLIRLLFPLLHMNLRLTCTCPLLIDVDFVGVTMTGEAEVSLKVSQTFLAPDTGTLGLEELYLGRLCLTEDV